MNQEQRQATYNKVKAHLLSQNKRAVSKDGDCLYRAPDGSKCAIGCLIPDDKYSPEFEHKSAARGIYRYGLGIKSQPEVYNLGKVLATLGFTSEDEHFISQLQSIHDRHAVESWRESLASFAIQEGLTP